VAWYIRGVLRAAVLAGSVALAGCSGRSEPAPPAPAPAPPPLPQDAGTTTTPGFDPAGGMDLDDGPVPSRVTPVRPKNRAPRPIDITLKSSPSGAMAAVDGVPIGLTPTFWPGESDGKEHEFTFTRAGYASARYRFVPITSGVLHVTLQAVAADLPDGGLGPLSAPEPAPDAAVAPQAPAPDAASRPAPPPTPPAPPATGPMTPAPPEPGAGPGSAAAPPAAPTPTPAPAPSPPAPAPAGGSAS
jgi:hypothetical protein